MAFHQEEVDSTVSYQMLLTIPRFSMQILVSFNTILHSVAIDKIYIAIPGIAIATSEK